jgi:hypothetical protein
MAFNNIHHKTRKSVEKGKEEGGKTKKSGIRYFYSEQGNCHFTVTQKNITQDET